MNFNLLRQSRHPKAFLATMLTALALVLAVSPSRANAQDQDDPPSRVARLGYMEGSVSFQPAGENEWVEAVPNRPITTGDRLWTDENSRAEVELGSASIHLSSNTGFSFLNLDDNTVQIKLTSGGIDIRVRRLDRDDVFEIDTPNQAFTAFQPGWYRVEASEDGGFTVVTIRDGEGESTGNGQRYSVHSGQSMTLSGTDYLSADVQEIADPDDFDNWSYARERRYEHARSAQYCSDDLVGVEDLDDNGDWRPDASYGNVWFPRVSADWAPYHDGHWAWIDPWGWTWVDDAPWGYAPFHYGRWISIRGRWGWIPGPRQERPVYAPALVAFVGGAGFGAGADIAWFPLGPREVYVPSYRVSPAYVNRVNITNTTVNSTVVTNVYNTTIVNKTTNITNITYVNRNVQGAVTAVPQRTFATSQPVARAAVKVNAQQLAASTVTARAVVPPAREAVLGVHANTANRVKAPPQAVMNRAVIAKKTPPPPPPSFAAKQQQLQAHPGEPVARRQMQTMRPAQAQAIERVKVAPPAKLETPKQVANQPKGNRPGANRPGGNISQPNRPQPGNQPGQNNRPEANRPDQNNRPNQPGQNNRPESNRPETNRPDQNNRPNQPGQNNRPESNRPEANRPDQNNRPNQPGQNNRPESNQPEANRPEPNNRQNQQAPNNRPEANRPEANRPEANRPQQNQPNEPAPNNRPEANRPEQNRPNQPAPNNRQDNRAEPNNRPNQPGQNNRPEANRPDQNRPEKPPARNDRPSSAEPNNNRPDNNRAQQPNRNEPQSPAQQRNQPDHPNASPNNRQQPAAENKPARPADKKPKPLTPEEKKRQDEQRKREEKPPQ